MKVKALRGVCIGVDRNLNSGDIADLDSATVQFLVSIKAVEEVKETPPPAAAEAPLELVQAPEPENIPESQDEPGQKSPPAKAGKKEKSS